MKISYDTPIPSVTRKGKHKWMELLHDFEKRTQQVMCLSFDTAKEALSARCALISSINRNKLGYAVVKRDKSVYICKGDDGKRKENGDGRT